MQCTCPAGLLNIKLERAGLGHAHALPEVTRATDSAATHMYCSCSTYKWYNWQMSPFMQLFTASKWRGAQ